MLDKEIKYTRGFYPDTANWATGLSLSFSPTDIFALRAKKRAEAFNFNAEQARYEQTSQRLKAQDARAKVMLDAARKLAANAPLQLKAAQETELRIRARYQAELATVTEVAEAQRLFAQSEIENALARLSVWRALLKIPRGQTRSYAWVAQQIRRPRAMRAVGAACGANPIPIIVPCHRVIASDGSLGGFSGGLQRKRNLLRLEGVRV